jgi:hypothetical protein
LAIGNALDRVPARLYLSLRAVGGIIAEAVQEIVAEEVRRNDDGADGVRMAPDIERLRLQRPRRGWRLGEFK